MSIELYDKNGSLGQAATNTGFGEARRFVDTLGKEFSDLKQLFSEGKTENIDSAHNQTMQAAHKTKDAQVRNTLVNIGKLLKEAEDFAGVSTS